MTKIAAARRMIVVTSAGCYGGTPARKLKAAAALCALAPLRGGSNHHANALRREGQILQQSLSLFSSRGRARGGGSSRRVCDRRATRWGAPRAFGCWPLRAVCVCALRE